MNNGFRTTTYHKSQENSLEEKNCPKKVYRKPMDQAQDICSKAASGWYVFRDSSSMVSRFDENSGTWERLVHKVYKKCDGTTHLGVIKIEERNRNRRDNLLANCRECEMCFNRCEHWTDEIPVEYNGQKYDVHIFELLEDLKCLNTNRSNLIKSASDRTEILRKVAISIASGLHYLHNKGYLHKDIKLANVMMKVIADGYWPQIIDLGSAVKIDNGSGGCKTSFQGTTKHMLPREIYKKISESAEFLCTKSYDFFCMGLTILVLGALMIKNIPNGEAHRSEAEAVEKRVCDLVRNCKEFDPKEVLRKCDCSDDEIDEFFTENLLDILYKCCAISPGDRYSDGELLLAHLNGKKLPAPRPLLRGGYKYTIAQLSSPRKPKFSLCANGHIKANSSKMSFSEFLSSFSELRFKYLSDDGSRRIIRANADRWTLCNGYNSANANVIESSGRETIIRVTARNSMLTVTCITCDNEEDVLAVHTNYDRVRDAMQTAGAFIDNIAAQLTGVIEGKYVAIVISNHVDAQRLDDFIEGYNTVKDSVGVDFDALTFEKRFKIFVKIEHAVRALCESGVPLSGYNAASGIKIRAVGDEIYFRGLHCGDMTEILRDSQRFHYRRICADSMKLLMQCAPEATIDKGKLVMLSVDNLPCKQEIKEYVSSVLLHSDKADDLRRRLEIGYSYGRVHCPELTTSFRINFFTQHGCRPCRSNTYADLSSIVSGFPRVPLRFAECGARGGISCYAAEPDAFRKIAIERNGECFRIETNPVEIYSGDTLVCGKNRSMEVNLTF